MRATKRTRLERIESHTSESPILWAFVYDRGEVIATVPNAELFEAGIDAPGAAVALHWGTSPGESVLVAGTMPLASLLSWPR